MKSNKKYRPNVAAVILSPKYPHECKIFVGNRIDMKEDAWQFPQGGIDELEDPKEALYRELKEEIGTSGVEIIAEYPEWITYDFTNKAAKKIYPYDGQTQKYFLVKLKSTVEINVNTKDPEFSEYMFVEYKYILDHASYMKKQVYKKVLGYFRKMGYL